MSSCPHCGTHTGTHWPGCPQYSGPPVAGYGGHVPKPSERDPEKDALIEKAVEAIRKEYGGRLYANRNRRGTHTDQPVQISIIGLVETVLDAVK